MEIYKAKIRRGDKSTALDLSLPEKKLSILLTEDNPNAVKSVFNELLKHLKKKHFNFSLEDEIEDLFFHISKEYIKQLNSELSAIYTEIVDLKLNEVESPTKLQSTPRKKAK